MCINRPRSDLSKSEGRVDGRSRADAYVLPESKSVGGLFSSVVCILDVVDVDRHEASARKKAESVRGTSRGGAGGSRARQVQAVMRFAFESSRELEMESQSLCSVPRRKGLGPYAQCQAIDDHWRFLDRIYTQAVPQRASAPGSLKGRACSLLHRTVPRPRPATIRVVRLKAFLFATITGALQTPRLRYRRPKDIPKVG